MIKMYVTDLINVVHIIFSSHLFSHIDLSKMIQSSLSCPFSYVHVCILKRRDNSA